MRVLHGLPAFALAAPQSRRPRRRADAMPALNSTPPIAVNADSFLADLNAETGTYTGNVIVARAT